MELLRSFTDMHYSIIQPPFTLKFRQMSEQELKDYYQWFLGMIPKRICELEGAVTATPRFETWSPDLSAVSLDALGVWFAENVETRQRTSEEVDKIQGLSTLKTDSPEEELTNKTFSLSLDIGMYLSQVLVNNYPNIKWHQPLDDKKFVYFGQPVLIGFGRVPLNPIRIIVTLAYGIASGKQTGIRLKEIYEYWSQHASKNTI